MDSAPIIASAPGKVILFGEHAVVFGKTALAASLSNLRTFAHLTAGGEGVVALELPDLPSAPTLAFALPELQALRSHFHGVSLTDADEKAAEPADDDAAVKALKVLCAQRADESEHHFSALVVFLYLYLSLATAAADRGTKATESVRVRIRSTVPVGAGLGSSAAFSVSCAAALLQHFHGSHGADGAPTENAATSKANINRWALKAEKIIHGTPSGIDNSIATFGGALTFHRKQVEGRVVGVMEHLDSFPPLQFVLTNTAVPRKTSVLVAGVRTLRERYPEVIDPVLDSIHALTVKAIGYLAAAANSQASEGELHTHLASLIDVNHHLLNAVGVGHPQLDKIRLLSAQYKLHSKLTGAGGGGCAFTLLTNETSEEQTKQLIADLDREFGPSSSLTTGVGGPGVTFHGTADLPTHFHN